MFINFHSINLPAIVTEESALGFLQPLLYSAWRFSTCLALLFIKMNILLSEMTLHLCPESEVPDKENMEMRAKVVDLESRSRRNNIRLYGVPEEKEGRSVIEFVNKLFKRHLALLEGLDLRVQRAHRALIPRPAAASSPRSIIVNFLEFHVKRLVLRKAWQQKIEINGKRLYFDNDYATDTMERRKAYIKAALKGKGIRYQTPYTKMRVHWDSGLVIYCTAEEAARDLNRRGIGVKVMTKTIILAAVEDRLNAAMPWKRTNTSAQLSVQGRG